MKTHIYTYNRIIFENEERKKYVQDENNLIAVYNKELSTDNIKIGNQCYCWCSLSYDKDKKYFFVEPYEINKNPERVLENQTNAYCPVCGYVDYDSWEDPDGDYKCPQCKSQFTLDTRYETQYGDEYTRYYKRLTLKKVYNPKKLKIELLEVQDAR